MDRPELDLWHMRRALDLAVQGQGHVEPNPMVGCVIVQGAEIIGEGWHRRFGEPHAEVEALKLAGERAAGATMYVTLEPCCHHGKTPPCTKAILKAGITRVVAALRDPFPQVAGQGLAELEAAGVHTEVGVLAAESQQLNAPYLKLVRTGRPWVIGKWAMTLDGKIATRTGSSMWVSNESSRAVVHKLRGRMDAIMIGRETARRDDPLLTARPPGPRTPLRIVMDTHGSQSSDSQLVRTAQSVPLMVAVGSESLERDRCRLRAEGCEVWVGHAETHHSRLDALLDELGRRRMTNVLVEGGGRMLGSLLDHRQLDEIHVFIAPKLVGGAASPVPTAGEGVDQIAEALMLPSPQVEWLAGDIYIRGRIASPHVREQARG